MRLACCLFSSVQSHDVAFTSPQLKDNLISNIKVAVGLAVHRYGTKVFLRTNYLSTVGYIGWKRLSKRGWDCVRGIAGAGGSPPWPISTRPHPFLFFLCVCVCVHFAPCACACERWGCFGPRCVLLWYRSIQAQSIHYKNTIRVS